jgi:hypothetical protein
VVAIAWVRAGPDFPTVETLFGDVNADECHASFQFGTERGPLYVPGPYDSLGQIGERMALLRNRAA